MDLARIVSMIFTHYLIALLLICGIITGFLYPMMISGQHYPKEYKIGKYVGYGYIGLGIVMFFITMILG